MAVETLLTQRLTGEAMSSEGTFSGTFGGTGAAEDATEAAAAGSLSTLDGTQKKTLEEKGTAGIVGAEAASTPPSSPLTNSSDIDSSDWI